MKSRLILFCILLFAVHSQRGFAQLGISHEIGVLVGPASFFTDYGERWNLKNNIENAGFGVGLVHYMNFAYKAECNCYATDNFFNDHFKIRTEMDYFTSKLEHFGPVASKNNFNGELLRAMHGRSQLLEIGASLEYYPLSIRDFASFAYKFSPFVSLGVHFVYFNPDAYSDFGDLNNPKVVFPTFIGGMDFEGGTTWAIAGSIGTRYRLNVYGDLVAEARWHYYDSDFIDGLNINAPQNKFNDFIFWVNIGYVYYLNY
jgi:hypothetical protein